MKIPTSSVFCGALSFLLSSLLGARSTHRQEREALTAPRWLSQAPGRLAVRAAPRKRREATSRSCSRSLCFSSNPEDKPRGSCEKGTRHFPPSPLLPSSPLLLLCSPPLWMLSGKPVLLGTSEPAAGSRAERVSVHLHWISQNAQRQTWRREEGWGWGGGPQLHRLELLPGSISSSGKSKMNTSLADLAGLGSRSDVLCKASMPNRSSVSIACTQKVLHKCLRWTG